MNLEMALRLAYRQGLSDGKGILDEGVVVSNILDKVELRRFTMGDWIFDVKQVRALKVATYGEPYIAAANITLNGNSAYVDTLVARSNNPLTRHDIRTITHASKKLGADSLEYDRINENGKRSESIKL